MPIIDFTGSYRDATRGATIKALQERQKALQATVEQQAAPREMSSPWQGGAQLLGVLGAKLNEGRAQEQEMAGRKRFAELLSGGLSPDELGEAMTLDPEGAKYIQSHQWDVEQKKTERDQDIADKMRDHGWDVEKATAAVEADKAAAAERARVDAAQQEDQQAAAAALSAQGAGQQSEIEKQKAAEVQPGSVPDILARAKAGQYGDPNDPAVQARVKADIDKAQYIAPGSISNQFSPYEQKRDQDFAVERGKYESEGRAGIESQKANVNKALELLESGESISGSRWQSLREAIPEDIRGVPARRLVENLFNPSGQVARDAIRS